MVREFVHIFAREKIELSIEGTTVVRIANGGAVLESESTCFVPSDIASPYELDSHFEGQWKASGLPQVEHL